MSKILRLQVFAVFLMASFIILSVIEFNSNLLFVGAQTEVITNVSIKAEASIGEYDYPPVHIITKISPLPRYTT
jgi:hypothetical protein